MHKPLARQQVLSPLSQPAARAPQSPCSPDTAQENQASPTKLMPPSLGGGSRGARAGYGSAQRGPRFAQQTLGFFWAQPRKMRRSRPISRVLSWTVIPLGASSPIRSSNLPGDTAGRGIVSLFGLAPGGVCRAGPLPDSRCALTTPFHPCHAPCHPFAVSGTTWPASPASAPLRYEGGKGVAGPFGGIFLLHFPSARAAQALPGTVPCGARTFLGIGIPENAMTRLPGRLRLGHCRTGTARACPGGFRPSPPRKIGGCHHQTPPGGLG